MNDDEKRKAKEEQEQQAAEAQEEENQDAVQQQQNGALERNSLDANIAKGGSQGNNENDSNENSKNQDNNEQGLADKAEDAYDKAQKAKKLAELTEKATSTAEAASGTAAATGAAGAAGGTAAAGGAAAAAPVVIIVLIVILIILILLGIVGFFTTMPQSIWNRLKQFAVTVWDDLQGYVIGMDEATVSNKDIIYTAQYLHDMGYDLVGMGFAESVIIAGQPAVISDHGISVSRLLSIRNDPDDIPDLLLLSRAEDGFIYEPTDEIQQNQIVAIDAPYLRSYLVAENRTYLVNNYTFNLEDFFNSMFDGSFFGEGHSAWGTGLIQLDNSLTEKLGIPWSINSIRINGTSLGEIMDGVKIDRETNTMRIRRLNLEANLLKSHYDYTYFSMSGWTGRYGKPFELMLSIHQATMAPDLVKEIAMNEDLDAKVNVKLKDTEFNGEVLVDGKTIDQLEESGQYDDETIQALRDLERDNASEVKTSIPYISSVTNHWFRNVYFEGTSSIGAGSGIQVGIDEDGDGLEDYNESTGQKTQKTRSLSSSDDVYSFEDSDEDMEYQGDPIEGIEGTITFRGVVQNGAVQNKDAVRGVTNQTTKRLFTDKYYIYDGTIAKAKKIQDARANNDDSLKEPIKFTEESLQAFTILEGSETLDAQYIYRDLKELVVELGYYDREDFDIIEKKVLEWPVPQYVPAEWPDREYEKQISEYGTAIACEETVAHYHGISVDDLRKLTGTEEEEEEDETEEDKLIRSLNRSLFIGDSYITGLENSGVIEKADFYGRDSSTPQYWVDNISELPENPKKIIIYSGLNNLDRYDGMLNLVDALRQKYEKAEIYPIELMHVSSSYENADEINKKIDTFNGNLRNKCKTLKDVRVIDASSGFVSGGYLSATSDGIHIQDYRRWAVNIALEIDNPRVVSSNPTDEEAVMKLLDSAKELSEQLKKQEFTYGTPEFIPPKIGGATTEAEEKLMCGDRFVAWALYKTGFTDQPEEGLTVGEDGDFISYCEDKEWKRIEDASEVHAGDLVFCGQLDEDGEKASRVYICAGEGKRYDCNGQERMSLTGPYSSYESQPFNEGIDSDFMCAYRITGDGVTNTGTRENQEVVAMANGKVTRILDENNNMFSLTGLSRKIDGTEAKEEEDPVEGREECENGVIIKITDKALKGYTLIVYGFNVEGISEGQTVATGDILGKTVNSDIVIILIDRDKAVVEDVENYIKFDVLQAGHHGDQEYEFQEGDLELLADAIHHEGCGHYDDPNGSHDDKLYLATSLGFTIVNKVNSDSGYTNAAGMNWAPNKSPLYNVLCVVPCVAHGGKGWYAISDSGTMGGLKNRADSNQYEYCDLCMEAAEYCKENDSMNLKNNGRYESMYNVGEGMPHTCWEQGSNYYGGHKVWARFRSDYLFDTAN